MMKKILLIITLILLFVAYHNLNEFISNSVYGALNSDGKLSQSDIHRGWDAVLAAWPIALAGALIVGAPGLLVLAMLYAHASAADNRELMNNVNEKLESAQHAIANARADAEHAVEHRIETARQIESHAEQLLSQSLQIKAQADAEITELREKLADAESRRSRAFEGFKRLERKNRKLEAGFAAMNSAIAANTLKDLGFLDGDVSENGK